MGNLLNRQLAEITWEDIADLIESDPDEDLQIEFKKGFSTKGDGSNSAELTDKKLSDKARDALAKEIIAFANTYGGLLIVGIDEKRDSPPRKAAIGDLVPDCIAQAAKLDSAMRAIIDPPLSMFEVRGIEQPNGDKKVFLLFRVGPSDQAPHGFGSPPKAYIRRANKSEPMTMRDMQSVFWESRTKQERITRIQQSFSDDLTELYQRS